MDVVVTTDIGCDGDGRCAGLKITKVVLLNRIHNLQLFTRYQSLHHLTIILGASFTPYLPPRGSGVLYLPTMYNRQSELNAEVPDDEKNSFDFELKFE